MSAARNTALALAALVAVATLAAGASAQTPVKQQSGPAQHMTADELQRRRGVVNPNAQTEAAEEDEDEGMRTTGVNTNFEPLWHLLPGAPQAPANDPPRAGARSTQSFFYSSRVTQTFKGIDQPGTNVPADCNLAVGPNHLVAMVNRQVAMFTKDSTQIYSTGLDAFFLEPAGGGWFGSFDPKVAYDPGSGRFFAVSLNLNASLFQTHFNLAVSASSDPTGGWYVYHLNNILDSLGIDYPEVGFGPRGVYITGNYRDGRTFSGWPLVQKAHATTLWVIDKGPLLSGGDATLYRYEDLQGRNGVYPQFFKTALAYGIPPAGVDEFVVGFVGDNGTQHEHLFAVTLPAGFPSTGPSVAFSYVDTDDPGAPPNASQKGGTATLDASRLGAVPLCATYRNGHVVTVTQGPSGSYSKVRAMEFDVSSWPTLSLVHQLDFTTGSSFEYWPAVTLNDFGDMGLVYTRSGSTEYPGAVCTMRAQDEFGFDGSTMLHTGDGYYNLSYEASPHRWGDYAGAAVDPVNQNLWYFNMYATSGGAWSSQIGCMPHAVYVDPANLGSQGGSRSRPYFSLLSGYAVAQPGNDLVVKTGTYPGSYTFTKALSLVPDGGTVQLGP